MSLNRVVLEPATNILLTTIVGLQHDVYDLQKDHLKLMEMGRAAMETAAFNQYISTILKWN